ncbi:MAG TPA: hypothetical protein VHD31_03665 [Candidatus Paceibacterota bacterium]|nr:hypothetical protein [Candidatus Paceibacterota bacterium]
MIRISTRVQITILALLYVLLSCAVFAFGVHKSVYSVSSTDRVYYEEFYAGALDKNSPQRFSNPPQGTSIIFAGPDGAAGLHAGIHFEPIKYAAAAVWTVFGGAHAVELFYIALFFLPLLYGGYILYARGGDTTLFLCLLAYAFSPAVLNTATDDLRPYIALLPGVLLFFLSVLYKRPVWEKFLFLNLVLAVREEALLLVLPVLAYLFVREYASGISRTSWALLFNWCGWLLANTLYIAWIAPHYAVRGSWSALFSISERHLSVVLVVILVAAGVTVWALANRDRIFSFPYLAEILLLAPFLALLVASPFLTLSAPFSSLSSVLQNISGRYGMILTVFLLMFVLAQFVDNHVRTKLFS